MSVPEKRIFRFADPVTGAGQIAPFPEEPPPLDDLPSAQVAALSPSLHDLVVRARHFTEIENFTFLGYVLAHEISEEELGDELLSSGIDWEHLVAAADDIRVPGDPLKVNDADYQALVNFLDEKTEALVREVNLLSLAKGKSVFELQQKQTKEA